jgi:glycosyltransferase involved in cell wall biosynthesis
LPSFIGSIPRDIPIIWTIHDMSALAGGCFTNFGCPELADGCRKCPLLKKPFDRILPRKEFLRRQRALSGRRVIAVGNSAHTTRLIGKSLLFRESTEIATIHPSINPKEWIAHDKSEARRLLGIKPDRFVMGFGAASLTDENKGFGRFVEVAEKVAERKGDIEALVFGDGIASAGGGRVTLHALGRMSSPRLQSLVYSAMDVFVVASRMETFGQVATEAQACGIPVWAFDVGGLPDAIRDGVTGRLIPFADICGMAESICNAANQGSLAPMGEAGARWVRESFTTERMAEAYLQLYEKALAPSCAQTLTS